VEVNLHVKDFEDLAIQADIVESRRYKIVLNEIVKMVQIIILKINL
jgi:hypothetical protein